MMIANTDELYIKKCNIMFSKTSEIKKLSNDSRNSKAATNTSYEQIKKNSFQAISSSSLTLSSGSVSILLRENKKWDNSKLILAENSLKKVVWYVCLVLIKTHCVKNS